MQSSVSPGLETIILEGGPLHGVGLLHDPGQRRRVHFEEEEEERMQ